MNSKFQFKANELADKSAATVEFTDAFCKKDWIAGAEYGYEVGLTENNEMLLKDAHDIIVVVARRWPKYTTGEKAKEWIQKYYQRNLPSV